MSATRTRARWRRLAPSGLLALAGIVLLALGTPFALGGYTTKVLNSTNSAATGIFAAATCQSTVTAMSAYFAYPFSEASGTTAADVSGNNRPGTYNTSGVTYGAAGPCPRDARKAITLDGSSGYVTTGSTVANPSTFTEEIWFKTSTARGGKLIGFGNSRTGSSGQFDRHVYLSNAGTVIFGVYPGAVRTVVSPRAYNDNTWHQAVATLAPSGNANPGMRLYVDGALVASDAATTTAESYTGYWRIGYDNLSGWTLDAELHLLRREPGLGAGLHHGADAGAGEQPVLRRDTLSEGPAPQILRSRT